MPTTITLAGQLVNKEGKPVSFARVEAWDKDVRGKDDFLGSSSTDQDGNFSISPSSGAEMMFDKYPDIYFKVIVGNELMLNTEDKAMQNLKESPDPITLTVDVKEEEKAPTEPDTTGASVYYVQNQWGGDRAPWHDGGAWVLGIRGSKGQYVVALDIRSGDEGKSYSGTMTYSGEGPIGFRATQITGNSYAVENQWGGDDAFWHPGGTWLIGGRDQHCIAVNIQSADNGKTLTGTMTYTGEGPIGFKAEMQAGHNAYITENQWGGDNAPWNPGGVWILGGREEQNMVHAELTSDDKGHSLHGMMTYNGEGPIGFRGERHGDNEGNNYHVDNQWGGSDAPWHVGGIYGIGAREHQHVVALNIKSDDEGKTLSGTMTYYGEGPIGFRAKQM
jgi:hypothetical protein